MGARVEKVSAEDDLRMRLRAIREIGDDQGFADATIARNVLHEDLGYFDAPLQTYNLDDATRDRLLVHARQDAAHAVITVGSLAKEMRKLRRMLTLSLGISVMLVLAAIVGIAAHFWT
jgi:hypothetical protein